MNEADQMATDYLFQKANRLNIPLGATFELSPVCNLNCKMCYVRTTREEVNRLGGEKTANDWIEMAKQCKEAGTLYILLTGGEPFLYKDFKYLYKELKKMGFILSINSNGTMLNDETIDWLIEDPPNKINITLYGASNKTYKRLCNSSDGYDKVTYAIKRLKEAGVIVVVNASMTPDNIDDYEDLFKFTKENDTSFNATSYMFPPIRRDKSSFGKNNRFSPEEAGRYAVKFSIDKMGIEGFCNNTRIMELKIKETEEVFKKIKGDIEGVTIPCRAGRSTFWISWDGKMTPCGIMQEPIITYPFKDGFEVSWRNMVNKIKSIKTLKECCNCKYNQICNACPAMCYSECGDINGKPDYICNMNKSIMEQSRNELIKFEQSMKENV